MHLKAIDRVVGKVQLTEDMAKTLYFYFDRYEVDGVITVEVLEDGSLWLPHSDSGTRQFLGSTRRRRRPDA